jgi:2-phosphoglycolate phosphatase
MRTSFSLIVFDLDGTLVDTAEDIAAALNVTLLEAGFSTLPTAEVIGYVGDGAARLLQRALPPINGADLPKLVQQFKTHYAASVCVHSRLYPGMSELLARLAATTPLAVVTNKPGDLARALFQALGIAGLFRNIIGEGDGFPRKPAPDSIRWLLEQHQLVPGQALLVGDGLPDLQVGAAVGCSVAAAGWGYTPKQALADAGATYFLETPAELAALL